MKKTYLAPALDVQKFDVADIITASEVTRTPSSNGTIANDGTANSVEIIAKW
ncbi:MAG: hypothetical protein IJ423_04195 [Clostridia bacterium]|nr:hypothetical protein [Clostridia bacterium]